MKVYMEVQDQLLLNLLSQLLQEIHSLSQGYTYTFKPGYHLS